MQYPRVELLNAEQSFCSLMAFSGLWTVLLLPRRVLPYGALIHGQVISSSPFAILAVESKSVVLLSEFPKHKVQLLTFNF